MKPSILAIRSIGGEFANRVFYPVVIVAAIIAGLLLALVVWLTTIDGLWILLAIPVIIAISIAGGLLAVIKLLIRSVTPAQDSAQKKATKSFVDSLQRVSDVAQTPKIVLLFRIARDVAAPRESGFIGTLATDTTSLHGDFRALSALFDQRVTRK